MQGDYTGLTGMQYPDDALRRRIESDKRDLIYNRGTLQARVFDLSVAQPVKEFDFAGDVLYIDKLSTGTVSFRFDMSWQRGFPMSANSAMRGFPYKSLFLEWEAQAGKTATVWFGYGVEIVPPNQDITTIGSITNPVDARPYPYTYGTSYQSITALAAATPETVFAPGSNTAGASLWDAQFYSYFGTNTIRAAFLTKASAPGSIIDGTVIVPNSAGQLVAAGSPFIAHGRLQFQPRIVSGQGLYFIADRAEGEAQRQAKYTL